MGPVARRRVRDSYDIGRAGETAQPLHPPQAPELRGSDARRGRPEQRASGSMSAKSVSIAEASRLLAAPAAVTGPPTVHDG
jgi:hypothetical protein